MGNKHEKFHYEARYTVNILDSYEEDRRNLVERFDTEQEAHIWALGKALDKEFASSLLGKIEIHEVETRTECLYSVDKESALQKLILPRSSQ